MIPACEMDAAHAVEFVSVLILGSIILGTFIAVAVVSFIGAVATFNHGEEQPFVETNSRKPVNLGDNLSN